MSYGLDPELLWLWLWCRPAATALIRFLAWEPPYATGVALEKVKSQKKIKNKNKYKKEFKKKIIKGIDIKISHYKKRKQIINLSPKIMGFNCIPTLLM